MNKDNFWNIVFWLGMSTGTLISFFLAPKANSEQGFSYLALAVFLSTLIGVPILVRSFSKVTFVKENIFVNSEGRELKVPRDLPMAFFVIVGTVGTLVLTGLLLDKYKVSDLISILIFVPLLFGIPTLFFIFKNCPISILFNRKVWSVMANVKGSGNNLNHLHSSTLSNTDAGWRNSASYYYRPGNIYYDRNR
jgi:MFS family permease